MRRLLVIVALVVAPLGVAWAATQGLQLCDAGGAVNQIGCSSPSGASNMDPGTAYSSLTIPTRSISGTVTFDLYGSNSNLGGNGVAYFGVRHSGVDTDLCGTSFTLAVGTGAHTVVTCSASGGVLNADYVYFKYTVSSGTPRVNSYATGFPYLTVITYTYSSAATCACGGACGGSVCGTTHITGANLVCDCGSVCNGVPAAPSPFTAVYGAGGMVCTWGAAGSPYALSRDGSSIYSGASTTYTDHPSLGAHAYAVYGTGTCTPSDGASFVTGTTAALTATATVTGSRGGAIIGCW